MKLLLLSLRSLKRFEFYSIINILGLALSLTCVIIISRYAYSELSTDRFNSKLDRLSLITFEYPHGIPGIRLDNKPMNPLLNDISVEKTTSLNFLDSKISYNNNVYETKVLITDSNFLQLLDYPLIAGNQNTLFKNPNGVAITRSYAEFLFGKEDPIGKEISFTTGQQAVIEGIIGKPSTKSSFSFDLVSSSDLNIGSGLGITLVLLYPNIEIQELNKRWSSPIQDDGQMGDIKYQFFPLKKLYFDKTIMDFYGFGTGNYNNILMLSATAILILFVGLFNYINIYALIQQKRNREFGLKKVFGTGLHHIISQLLLENFILISVALLLSWVFVELAGGLFQSYLGLTQVIRPSFNLLLSVGILLSLPLIVSVHPFLKFIYSPTISSLRSSFLGRKPGITRSIFLSFQYVISITLIIMSLLLVKQLNYMLTADPGYLIKDMIKVPFTINDERQSSYSDDNIEREDKKRILQQITKEMDESPIFRKWQFSVTPNKLGRGIAKFKTEDGKFIPAISQYATNKYLDFYEFQLIEGRSWDETQNNSIPIPVIVNESALKAFEITDIHNTLIYPENSYFPADGKFLKNPSMQIIGVIKDFRIGHLSGATPPIIFYNYDLPPLHYPNVIAVISPGKRVEAIHFFQKIHDEIVGGDFTYSYIEDEIKALYEEDKKITTIFSIFAFIAILISSMGLFGISLFDVQQRYKEIAIRKVNGATASVIMKMLLKKYTVILLVSFIIATPISWLFLRKYLEGFAYKTSISWWLFAVALLITAGIALITLYWQVKKAAETNPAEAIKSE